MSYPSTPPSSTKIFRPGKAERRKRGGVFIFALFGLLFPCAMLLWAQGLSNQDRTAMFIIIAAYTVGAPLAFFYLRHISKEYLAFEAHSFICHHHFNREVLWSDVAVAQWYLVRNSKGMILSAGFTLSGPFGRVPVSLKEFDPAAREAIMQLLRDHLPENILQEHSKRQFRCPSPQEAQRRFWRMLTLCAAGVCMTTVVYRAIDIQPPVSAFELSAMLSLILARIIHGIFELSRDCVRRVGMAS